MPQLQPAGFFSQILSALFPKQMSAEVRTEVLPNGQIQAVPIFVVDGQEVPAELVGDGSSQTILGYKITLDQASQQVRRQTQGKPTRLSKRKAAEFLGGLGQSGVSVRSKDGRVQAQIKEVKPNVELKLQPDDSLSIESELVMPNGVVVAKPPRLEELRYDEGWFSIGDDLVKVITTGTSLDQVLIPQGSPDSLVGDDVPQFLKLIGKHRSQLGEVEKDLALEKLAVFGDKVENRAKVDGNSDSISVSPTLVFHGPQQRQYEGTPELVDYFDKKGGGFQRVSDGWIELTAETIKGHRRASEELDAKLGGNTTFRGTDIPKVLTELVKTSQGGNRQGSPWTVYFSEAVKNSHRVIDTPANVEFKLNIVDSDGRSLLELDPIYNHERFKLTHNEAQQAASSGDDWIRRRDTWVKVDAEKYGKIEAGADSLGLHRGPNGFTFPASQRERVLELFSVLGSIQHSDSYAAFLSRLADFEKIEDVPLPASLRPEIHLRTYQKHGFNWLAFLHRFGLNGILADDMGLGKTLQTLAVIHRAREMTRNKFPSLIICPTSVVSNWKLEVEKFFKDTCVITYTGDNREPKLRLLHEMLAHAHRGWAGPLVVTSYDIARRDVEKLNHIPWLYVVVDEGHNIKNPDAERSKAIKTINGQHKLALTGTPIQNNLEELWSLFDFAMPGFLGKLGKFRDQYCRNGKVVWEAVRGGSASLKERIHPFILRRLKETVATDLPPKIVVDQRVELTLLQVRLYKEVLASEECQRLVDEVNRNGVGRARPMIIVALTKLRAICNHPLLADANRKPGSAKCEDSGKLDCLRELIEEVIEGEHRALLFCQSTQMLDIIQEFFAKWKVCAIRLDGSTSPNQRQSMVDQFNRDTSIDCFLISTKAGGTGLNLTGADTVIFYDHDWNPANDRQAQDRAYRIGQTKPVTVYRLVSKGTIEEKIIERQAIKQSLADEIIGADEQGFKDLTKEDLLSLFQLEEPDKE